MARTRHGMKFARAFGGELWPHQLAALEMLGRFLRDRSAHGALVQMPTGTGKTLVIAGIAHEPDDLVLVLGPSAELVQQLQLDLSGAAWRRFNVRGAFHHRHVVPLLRSNTGNLLKALRAPAQHLFVGTMQALRDIETCAPDLYKEIRGVCSLIVVDEAIDNQRRPGRTQSRGSRPRSPCFQRPHTETTYASSMLTPGTLRIFPGSRPSMPHGSATSPFVPSMRLAQSTSP